MATSATDLYRELAYRVNDGVEVKLLWNQMTDDVTVTVSDQRSGTYFQLDAPPGETLDVFNHPYAYAALWGVPYAARPCLPSTQGAALLATDETEGSIAAHFAMTLVLVALAVMGILVAAWSVGSVSP